MQLLLTQVSWQSKLSQFMAGCTCLCSCSASAYFYAPHLLLYSALCVCVLQTMIEAMVDVKTTDGYLLRIFVMGFTSRSPNQQKKATYAQSSQVRTIRKKMVEIVSKEVSAVELKEVVNKL